MNETKKISLFRSGWMALAITFLVALFISADWYYYYRTRENLDGEFGRRLKVLAELVSAQIGAEAPVLRESSLAGDSTQDSLSARLEKIRAEHAIYNILVVREDGVTLFSLQPEMYPPGEVYPHWRMDYAAIVQALGGRPAATSLYRAPDGAYLKAGYAPVPAGARRAEAVVGVEANAGFLEGLGNLRSILLAVTGVSIIGVVLFTSFAFKATSSLVRARESLMRSETLAAMGRVAAGIAHEIRNPLFIIRGAAEKLRDAHPESARDIDGFVIEEVDRLNGILTDYLLFAKDEPMRRQSLDLVVTLNRSLRQVRESLERSAIELAADIGLGEAPFVGEEKKLQQAFFNVLLNAAQAIVGAGRITVSLAARGAVYYLRFTDTGSGIPERDLGKIFEPFYTTKPGGSGLGLAIAKRVIDDHGGRITVTSTPGAGTEVTITLPIPPTSTGGDADAANDARGAQTESGA
jgi:signal transduction histidine kinase